MDQYVVEVTVLDGIFAPWKGFAAKKESLAAVNSIDLAAKLSAGEAEDVAFRFNTNTVHHYAARAVPLVEVLALAS